VSSASVLRSVDPRLDWASLFAVLQWRFTPVIVGGTPTPIIMSVTVNFTLNRSRYGRPDAPLGQFPVNCCARGGGRHGKQAQVA